MTTTPYSQKLKHPASVYMLFALVSWLLAQFGFAAVMGVAEALGRPISFADNIWIQSVMQLVGILLPMFIWLLITKDSFKRNMPNRPLGWTNFGLLIPMSFLIIPLGMFLSAIANLFTTNDVAAMLEAVAAQPLWLKLLVFAVTPSVVEELVFRGYTQSNTRGGVLKIVVYNGFLFAMLHLSLHQFAYTFVLGAVFALMVYYTKNIWAGIIAHFIMNGTNVVMSHAALRFFGNGEVADEAESFGQGLYDAFAETNPEFAQQAYEWGSNLNMDLFAIAVVGVIALFTTAGFVGIFVAFVSHNRKRGNVDAVAIAPEDVPEERKRFSMDWWLVAVVVLYVLVLVGTHLRNNAIG